MRVRVWSGASVVLAAAISCVLSGSALAATGPAAIAMYSDTGDYIGQGTQQLFIGSAGLSGSAGEAIVDVSGPNGASYTLDFAAPPGAPLQPGIYDHAARVMSRGTGQPGIDISGDGRGCNTDAGRFEVRDIGFDSSGTPDRLWLIYEQHCEGAQPALFGEVRVGEPAGRGALDPVPTTLRWPANNYGTPETVVPVRFVASAPVSLGNVSLAGNDPGDFLIRLDGCSGRTLPAGGSCDVWVRSTPSQAGLRTATLVVPDTGGTQYTVPLQSWTYGGTTRLVMSSDSGDYIGQGQQYNYDPSTSVIEVTGSPERVSFWDPSDDWSGDFTPAQGDILTAGTTYTGAERYPFNGTNPGLDIEGEGRGCNTDTGQFTVTEATYNPDGSLRTFGVRFEQHCEGAVPALHGVFDWRMGDNTQPAPWMDPSDGPSSSTGGGSSGGSGNSAQTATASSSSSSSSSSPGNTSKTASAPATGSASSPQTPAQALARTLLRIRNDVLTSQRTLAQLHRHPGSRSERRSAVTQLARLRQDVGTLARLLRMARPAGGPALTTWRRMESANSAWQAALLSEQRALQSPGPLPGRVWALDARARADGVAALKALVRLAHQT